MGSLLFTAGIGDFLALVPFVPEDDLKVCTGILLATRAATPISEIIDRMPGWEYLETTCIAAGSFEPDYFENRPLRSRVEALERCVDHTMRPRLEQSFDWSIAKIFPLIQQGFYTRRRPDWDKYSLTMMGVLDVPKKYAVLHGYSHQAYDLGRNFTLEEYAFARQWAVDNDTPLVYLGPAFSSGVHDPYMIDFRGETTILEAIEVTKHADAFFGIDSCLSVVAGYHVRPDHIHVKIRNKFGYQWRNVYWPKAHDVMHFYTRMGSKELD
jgi:hypothetical protein